MPRMKAAKHIYTTEGMSENEIQTIWEKAIVEMTDRNHKIWNYAKKNTPRHLWDDLWQDIVIILAKNKAKLVAAYLNNQHAFFVTRIIINQAGSSTSPFYSRFRQAAQESPGEDNIVSAGDVAYHQENMERKEELELQWNLIQEALKHSNITFYEDRILRMYFEHHMIATEISRDLQISTATVYNTVHRIVEKLKSEIRFYLETGDWAKENDEVILACRYPIAWIDADGDKRATFFTFNEVQRKTGLMPATVRTYLQTKRKMKDGSWFELDVDPSVLKKKGQ
jgi:DNA-binding CsgD family transcriptional regulator